MGAVCLASQVTKRTKARRTNGCIYIQPVRFVRLLTRLANTCANVRYVRYVRNGSPMGPMPDAFDGAVLPGAEAEI
jgi:hypothetical protein